MIRLTLILAIVLVTAMIILPQAGDDAETVLVDAESGETRPVRGFSTDEALVEDGDGNLVLVTADGEELPIALVIEPASLTEEDAAVNLPPAQSSGGVAPVDAPVVADGEDVAQTQSDPTNERLRVTGDRVNFRAGPSTNDAILAALTLGTEVELIERVADGWAHLRVPETGLSGYMSEDFLEPAN